MDDFPDECELDPNRCDHFCIRELVEAESEPGLDPNLGLDIDLRSSRPPPRVRVRCECDAGFALDPEDGRTCLRVCGDPAGQLAYDAKTDRCVLRNMACTPLDPNARYHYPNLEMAMLGYNLLKADPFKGQGFARSIFSPFTSVGGGECVRGRGYSMDSGRLCYSRSETREYSDLRSLSRSMSRAASESSLTDEPDVEVESSAQATSDYGGSAAGETVDSKGKSYGKERNKATGKEFGTGKDPTNIASVNLVIGCSKVGFFTILTPALAY